MSPYYINPYLFFLFHEGAFCLWNYQTHEQFEIDRDLITVLCEIAQNKQVDHQPLLTDLLDNDVIRPEPYPQEAWGWDRLSHIFHFGTQNVPELQEQRTKAEMIEDFLGFSEGYAQRKADLEIPQNHLDKPATPSQPSDVIRLSKPKPETSFLSFKDTLTSRMTSRHFSGEPITEVELSTLLYYSFGDSHKTWEGVPEGINLIGTHKTSPGAGGIHATQAYVVIWTVDGIKPGLYHYNSQDHSLAPVHSDISWDRLIAIMADQFYMKGLACGVFLVSQLAKVWTKYLHSRAYREVFLDAGHLSQTFQLTATALSLNTWVSGYFRDKDLLEFLKITGTNQAPVLFVGAGHGQRTPLHPDMIEALQKT